MCNAEVGDGFGLEREGNDKVGVFIFVENDGKLKGELWVLKELVIEGREKSYFCLLIPGPVDEGNLVCNAE